MQPAWAKDPHFGKRNAYNARGETLSEKPTFRSAFRLRRCVLPAGAFYERAEERWLRVEPAQGELFLFAVLWEPENEATEGVPTYTMVTTEPNEKVGEHHDRTPVVLTPGDADGWTRIEDAGPISRKRKDDEPGLF